MTPNHSGKSRDVIRSFLHRNALVALVTKLIGCGAGAWSLGVKRAAQVRVGMMPRGEVGIVVAQIGLSLGVIDARLFAVVIFMAVSTTLIAPPLLTTLVKAEGSR